jgi:hypothetical protein
MEDEDFIGLIKNNSNLQLPSLNLLLITADLSRPGKVFKELEKWLRVTKKLYENSDKKYKQKSNY